METQRKRVDIKALANKVLERYQVGNQKETNGEKAGNFPGKFDPKSFLSTEAKIRAWLAHIKETDEDVIRDVLDKCLNNTEARTYFLKRSDEVP